MIISVTGHRPNKLGGYDDPRGVQRQALDDFRQWCLVHRPSWVITGMALGFDQIVARACIGLKIPFTAAIPFEGQESQWPPSSQNTYRELLAHAADRFVVCRSGYSKRAMQARNEWMVDLAQEVVALWDGSPGGTGNCVRYAQGLGRPIHNLWRGTS